MISITIASSFSTPIVISLSILKTALNSSSSSLTLAVNYKQIKTALPDRRNTSIINQFIRLIDSNILFSLSISIPARKIAFCQSIHLFSITMTNFNFINEIFIIA